MPPIAPHVSCTSVVTVGPFYRHKTQILEKISLPLTPGRWIAIIGRSGIGKTTLLRCLAGLEKESPSRHGFKVSYIPQRDTLLPWKTAGENIALSALLQGRKIDDIRVNTFLDLMGLQGYQNHYPHQLSQGMRQRIALARSLFDDADLILMDEPFSSLDGLTRAELHHSIKTLLTGKMVVLVTHDVHEACLLGTDVYLLKNTPGTLTAFHTPSPQTLLEALER